MIEQFLNRIMSSLKDNESSDRKFRDEAAKNDKTLFSSIKDLSKRFSISEQNIDSINDSIESTNVEVQRSNQKIDSMQGLIRESISMQAQMLTELSAIKSDFKDLKESIEKTSGDSGGSIVGNFLNSLKQGAKSLGLGAASLAGLGSIDALVDMFKENFGGFDTTGELTGGSPGVSDSSQGAGAQTSGDTYKKGQAGSSTLASTNMSAAEKAILETISKGESGGKYNIINYLAPGGGGKPQYFEMSENVQHPFKGKKGRTASGRYQFLWTTWASEVRAMGEDPNNFPFTPENQDRVALSHAIRRYRSLSGGRDLLKDIESGNPQIHQNISRTLRPTWHGIQSGSYLGSAYKSFKGSQTENKVEGDDSGTHESGAMPKSDPTGNGKNTPEAGGDPEAKPIKKEQISTTGNIDLQSFSLKPPSHVQGLDEDFSKRLGQFLSDAQNQGYNIKIYSGYRSFEHQKRLWEDALKKYGSPEKARKMVAPPGRSRHNQGIAADLRYLSPGSENWAHKNASKYGLHFRMSYEPWHIEPINTQGASRRENVSGSTNVDGYSQQNFASTAAGGSLDFSGFSALESGLAGLGISLPTGGLLSAVSKIFGVDFGGFFGNLASAFGLTGGNVNDSQYQQQTSSQEIVNTPENSEKMDAQKAGPGRMGSVSVFPQSRKYSINDVVGVAPTSGPTGNGEITPEAGGDPEADDFPGNFIENIQRNFSLVMDTMSKEKTITQENQPASPQAYTTMAMSAPNVDHNGGNLWYINPEKTAFANWARGDNWVIEPIAGIKKNQPEWFNRTMFA